MSNDINILVTTELGDTLVKLDLAKHAVNDLGDASENAAAKQDAAAASTTIFDDALTGLSDALTSSVPLMGGFAVPLVALPVVAGAAAAAVVALADAIGTVIAIAAAFVAPISVVTGLLGTLGLGFALAAKKAFGMHEDGLGKAISGLKGQFNDLTTTLVGRFMPVFQFLIHNAHDALDFLGRIAKLPLDQAFRQLAQRGIPAVTQFFEHIGHLAAKPIRLALQIAFGQGKAGGEAHAAVAQMWNDFTNFLFGYTKTHPIRLPSGQVIQIDRHHVDGIFQPLLDWFGRHNFTKKGIQLGHEILNGVLNSKAAQKMGQWLVTVLGDAINTVEHHMARALGTTAVSVIVGHWKRIVQVISNLINPLSHIADFIRGHLGGAIRSLSAPLSAVRDWIGNKISSAITSIVNKFGNVKSAISTAKGVASDFKGVLDKIAGFFSRVFTFTVDWPSPPSWLGAVIGGLGGGSSGSTAGRTGQGGNSGPNVMPGANVAMGGNVAVIHVHGADLSSAAQRRVVGAQLGDTLMRRWAQQAGR